MVTTAPAGAVLLLSCPDRVGIVAAVTGLIAAHGGNIVEADQHTATTHQLFLQRIRVDLPDVAAFESAFAPLAATFDMTWELHRVPRPTRLAVLATTEAHCLADLLGRIAHGELDADVAFVAANRGDLREEASRFGVPFHHIPVDEAGQAAHEERLTALLDAAAVDLVVLARYMRILSPDFVHRYEHRIINIHHSFLPAFVGARPYHQAHERGVKLIGATAHYATTDLDEGPIIAQDVLPVSHRDDVERLKARGRDVEKVVLARAVRLHLEHRVLLYGNRTVVFD
jgi:formyltetrahydrofolate deformylase